MKIESSTNNARLWEPPLLALIGMGMGYDDLSLRALAWIDRAEVLVGGKRHLESFPDHPARKIVLRSHLDELLETVDSVSKTHRTAVLASGDPLFFGIGRRLVNYLGKERISILPNITAVQALFSRLLEPLEDARVVSLHGRGRSPGDHEWMLWLSDCSPLVIFTDPIHTPGWIAREILDAGILDKCLAVGEDLGLPSERVQCLSPEEAAGREFSPLNLVAVLSKKPEEGIAESPLPLPILGLPDSALDHQAGLITKIEVRAAVLAHLQLRSGLTLWDIGAGSGAVAIEASRVAALRKVFAVEKHPNRYRDLVANLKRMECTGIVAIQGRASEVLASLSDPDRVFIGGSGEDLGMVLDEVSRRLLPGGRVVQTVVTLDTLERVRAFWEKRPFSVVITQIQVNRSTPILQTLRFEALNPVFVVTVSREN